MSDDRSPIGSLEVEGLSMTVASATEFLHDAARYFEKRDTHGEDRAHWANAYNAKNCRAIAALIAQSSKSEPASGNQ